MEDEFSRFAARAGLAALARYREAVERAAEQDASAALTEWLFWWGVLDERHRRDEPTGYLDQDMRRALREARNASTHRSVVNGIPHSARVGEAIVGLTRLGQGWELAWSLGKSIPLGEGRHAAGNHAAYVARLAGQPTHLAAAAVERWLSVVAGPDEGASGT